MKRVINLLATGLIVATTGCGGGGGGSGVPNYSGAWNGWVSLVSNTCARTIPDEFKSINILHDVQQAKSVDADGNVTLDVVLYDAIDTYVGLGEVRADGTGNSFSVTGAPHELPGFLSGYTCIEILDFSYQSIDFSSGNAGFVERHSSIECTKGNSKQTCDVSYTGSAYRTADPTATPTPEEN